MLRRRDGSRQGITAQQDRFAQEHDATLGGHAAGCGDWLFVYRDEGWRTCRWLVDAGGNVMDFVSLHRPVREGRVFRRQSAERSVRTGAF